MSDLICGRTTHPIRLVVGGFSAIPTRKQLIDLKERLKEGLNLTKEVANVTKSVVGNFPVFSNICNLFC
jgi:coenzyme F420-reducing hydrogenase alpha subunit